MLMFCLCVCVDWVNVNVAAAEMLFLACFSAFVMYYLDCKMLVQLFGSQSRQSGFFQAGFYLSALVFVFVGGEAFVCVCVRIQFNSTCGKK